MKAALLYAVGKAIALLAACALALLLLSLNGCGDVPEGARSVFLYGAACGWFLGVVVAVVFIAWARRWWR